MPYARAARVRVESRFGAAAAAVLEVAFFAGAAFLAVVAFVAAAFVARGLVAAVFAATCVLL